MKETSPPLSPSTAAPAAVLAKRASIMRGNLAGLPAGDDSDSDDEAHKPSWRVTMTAIVAANKAAKLAAEKAAEEKAAAEKAAEEQTAKLLASGDTDKLHADARMNSESRKMLAKREEQRKRTKGFYEQMEKVRAVQQAAIASPHANTEKLQSRLRATRRSKELQELDPETPAAA